MIQPGATRALSSPPQRPEGRFSPDGTRILSGGYDRAAFLWDVEAGKALLKLEGHHDLVMCVAFTPDGRRALTTSYDRTLRLWNLRP